MLILIGMSYTTCKSISAVTLIYAEVLYLDGFEPSVKNSLPWLKSYFRKEESLVADNNLLIFEHHQNFEVKFQKR